MSSKGRGRVPSKLVPIEDGAGGQNSKPRKIFAKKDLIEAVRKIAPNKTVVSGGPHRRDRLGLHGDACRNTRQPS